MNRLRRRRNKGEMIYPVPSGDMMNNRPVVEEVH
jgi:hypothetical protein